MTKQPEVPNEDELDVAVGGGFPHEIGHNTKRTGSGSAPDAPAGLWNDAGGTLSVNVGIDRDPKS